VLGDFTVRGGVLPIVRWLYPGFDGSVFFEQGQQVAVFAVSKGHSSAMTCWGNATPHADAN
jgi:hypothetical protein